MFLYITNSHNVVINKNHFYESLSIISNLVDKSLNDKNIFLSIVSPKEIQIINKKYRGKDSVTDVLSFPLIEKDELIESQETDLGEIFICYEKVYQQANYLKHSIFLEWQVLFIHSMWHILGYDHILENDFQEMNEKEQKTLRLLQKNISL